MKNHDSAVWKMSKQKTESDGFGKSKEFRKDSFIQFFFHKLRFYPLIDLVNSIKDKSPVMEIFVDNKYLFLAIIKIYGAKSE